MEIGLRFSSILGVITALLLSATCNAEELYRSDTVETRSRSEVKQLGVRMGGFLVFPRLGAEGLYDDNIFRLKSPKEDDFIWIVSPELAVNTNWIRHAFNILASADLGRYTENSSEDFDDWNLSVDGRYDVGTGATISGGGGIAQKHLNRGDPDELGFAAEPIVYIVNDAFARYTHRPGRLSLSTEADFTRYDFDDTDRVGGGSIDQQFRDRNRFGLEIDSGYEFSQRCKAVLRLSGNRRDYENAQPLSIGVFAKRSSWGYSVQAGAEFDYSGIVFGELLLGYQQRIFDDQIFPNIDAPAVTASINWNVTTLTNINAILEQSIEETPAPFFSGAIRTTGAVGVNHELLRNLILKINVGITKLDYKSIGAAELDEYYYGAGVGINYLMNRFLYIKAGYNYTQREEKNSSLPPPVLNRDFEDNQVFIRMEFQL